MAFVLISVSSGAIVNSLDSLAFALEALAPWPNGKALLSGGKDSGFESQGGRFLSIRFFVLLYFCIFKDDFSFPIYLFAIFVLYDQHHGWHFWCHFYFFQSSETKLQFPLIYTKKAARHVSDLRNAKRTFSGL